MQRIRVKTSPHLLHIRPGFHKSKLVWIVRAAIFTGRMPSLCQTNRWWNHRIESAVTYLPV